MFTSKACTIALAALAFGIRFMNHNLETLMGLITSNEIFLWVALDEKKLKKKCRIFSVSIFVDIFDWRLKVFKALIICKFDEEQEKKKFYLICDWKWTYKTVKKSQISSLHFRLELISSLSFQGKFQFSTRHSKNHNAITFISYGSQFDTCSASASTPSSS